MTRLMAWATASRARARLAAFLLGLVAAAALPPLHLVPALAVAIPGLLWLIGDAGGAVEAGRRGFWFGFGLHLVGLYWITEAIMLESARYWWLVPLAVPALSAVLALFIAVPAAAARAAPPGWRRLLVFSGSWVLADLARQFVATGFPWNPLGSVWAAPGPLGDIMLQPLAWIGAPGLTLVTILIAGLFGQGRRGAAAAVTALAAWAALGVLRLQQPPPPDPGVAAVLVQGNVAHGAIRDWPSATAMLQRHLQLSADGMDQVAGRQAVVIWPESAMGPFLLDADPAARAAVTDAIRPARGAIIGTLRFNPGPRDTAHPPYNSIVALDPAGTVRGTYDKWHLVPFGEFAPSWVPLAIQIVPGQFGFGTGPRTMEIPGLPPFGGLVCYEAIYPGEMVDRSNRPSWLVNVTNDAWFGNSTGPRQHLAGARMRAVEEGLPLMRAANTGISAGFDAWGRELGRLGIGQAGVIVLDLPGELPPTWFSRFGLAIPAAIAVALTLIGFVGARMPRSGVPRSGVPRSGASRASSQI